MKIRRLILFFSIVLTFSISSYGQSYQTFKEELTQITERTRWQVGPFRIFPTIAIKDIGYDGNVYYQREEDEPVSDFTVTISPEVIVHSLYRNLLILSFTFNPEYVFYLEQERERGWNITFSPEFRLLLFNRFVLSGNYSYLTRRYRASSEFDVRARELREGLEGSIFYETARRTSFGISGSLVKISYEDVTTPEEEIYLSRDLNRKEESANFELYYRIFPEAFIFITGGYSEYNFEYPETQWRDSYSYQVYSGLRFPLLGKIRGTLALGYKNHVPLSEEKESFSGLVGDTSLEYRVRRFNFRLKYERDNHFSYWTESIYFVEDRYGAGISYYITRFLRLDGDYSYGIADYPETTTVTYPDGSVEEIKRKDIYKIYSVGFVIRLMENSGIGLKVSFWERDSNLFWEDRDRIFFGAYVTYEF